VARARGRSARRCWCRSRCSSSRARSRCWPSAPTTPHAWASRSICSATTRSRCARCPRCSRVRDPGRARARTRRRVAGRGGRVQRRLPTCARSSRRIAASRRSPVHAARRKGDPLDPREQRALLDALDAIRGRRRVRTGRPWWSRSRTPRSSALRPPVGGIRFGASAPPGLRLHRVHPTHPNARPSSS
jgi:hypothetical protein